MRPSVHGPAEVAATAVIGDCCTLAYPKETRLFPVPAAQVSAEPRPVVIGERCILFNQVIIYEGVEIGEGCVVEDRVRIGYDSHIGPRARLLYGAFICDRVTIGADTRVAGFVCDGTTIGERCTVMGSLVHEYAQPHRDWWEVDEEPPVVEPDSVIGYGATVVGGVRVGPRSYVAAGAVVTRDVPPEHVVTGVNVQTPAALWPGRRLQDLIRHWRTDRRPGSG